MLTYLTTNPTHLTTTLTPLLLIVIIIKAFIWRHKVVTSEALGPGSVLLRSGKRESPGEEECL